MENKLLKYIDDRKITVPKKTTARFFRVILSLKSKTMKPKYVYHFDKLKWKDKQIILLSDHASRDTFYYTLNGYKLVNPNVVVGYQNIFNRFFFKPMLKSGAILKSLYEADIKATKQMFDVVKKGGSICLFPEGIQSASGSTHPMNPSTIKFIKKLGLDVVLCKSYGTYLSRPRYSKTTRKGEIEIHYEVLFTKEDLLNMSVDELYDKFIDRFRYNDFKWNKEHQYKYIGKESNACGIEKILYYCPKCGKEFTLASVDDKIICSSCLNTIKVDEAYNLIPINDSINPFETIDDWFKYQRKLVRREITDPNFIVSYDAELVDLHYDKFYKDQYYVVGEGKVTINHEGIRYVGTKNNENVNLFFELINTPSFVFTPGKENDLYYHSNYYSFRPKENKLKVVKYMMYVEEMHNLIDDAWAKVSKDVYD